MTSQLAADGPGQAELRSGRWGQARDAFRGRLEQHPDGSAFEGLAQASWWLDDGSVCLEARENAYRVYRDAGVDTAAARAATALAYDSLLFGEGVPVASGWWRRAADLLERVPECEEHGWLAAREA